MGFLVMQIKTTKFSVGALWLISQVKYVVGSVGLFKSWGIPDIAFVLPKENLIFNHGHLTTFSRAETVS